MVEEREETGSILAAVAMMTVSLLVSSSNAQNTGEAPKVSDVKVGEVFEIRSKQLKEARKYSVSLPASYGRSDAEYPLVVVLDGEDYFVPAVGACRFMSMVNLMPEVVVVGIDNTNRRLDMTPPDTPLPDIPRGRGDAFLAFLEEELLPALKLRYHLLPLRVLVGHSHGAMIGAYAITARPELFRWQLLIDAPMQLGDRVSERRLMSYLKEHPHHTGRLISIERSFGWSEKAWLEMEETVPKSFSVSRMKMPGETHPTMFYPALYEGLRWLFKDIMVRQDLLASLPEMKTRYANLSAAYGYQVPIPRSLLSDAAEDQLMAGYPEEASAFVEEMKTRFGPSAETKEYESWIEELRKRPLEETYDAILRSPPPNADQAKLFLGTWVAVVQRHSPNNVEVTFEAQGDTVVARQREFDESGAEVKPILGDIAYLRMKGNDTIEWGYMNGMRPRTMIISYMAKLNSTGELTGASSPKAVSFSPDRKDNPGRPSPFKFVRKR